MKSEQEHHHVTPKADIHVTSIKGWGQPGVLAFPSNGCTIATANAQTFEVDPWAASFPLLASQSKPMGSPATTSTRPIKQMGCPKQ